MASILSLQSPVVIDFTPHPIWRECSEERLGTDDLIIPGHTSEVAKDDFFNESAGNLRDNQCSLLLMPCSLLIFKDQAYSGK